MSVASFARSAAGAAGNTARDVAGNVGNSSVWQSIASKASAVGSHIGQHKLLYGAVAAGTVAAVAINRGSHRARLAEQQAQQSQGQQR